MEQTHTGTPTPATPTTRNLGGRPRTNPATYIDRQFGRLTVTGLAEVETAAAGRTCVSCICHCDRGQETPCVVRLDNLLGGKTISCGCKGTENYLGHWRSKAASLIPEVVADIFIAAQKIKSDLVVSIRAGVKKPMIGAAVRLHKERLLAKFGDLFHKALYTLPNRRELNISLVEWRWLASKVKRAFVPSELLELDWDDLAEHQRQWFMPPSGLQLTAA